MSSLRLRRGLQDVLAALGEVDLQLKWIVDTQDVAKVRALVERAEANPFVQCRRALNLGFPRPDITRAIVWKSMVGCLLTTQQKSGPGKPVNRFLGQIPFPLEYQKCVAQTDLPGYATALLTAFGGIRRSPTIARELAACLQKLEQGHWDTLLDYAREVDHANSYKIERRAARYIAETFNGFGPKQARNLLQWVGVSKYEIPIDSRVTKWMNRELLSFSLNARLLADAVFYEMVSDGIIELCGRAEVIPCIFDAAVLVSFDSVVRTDVDFAAEAPRGA